MPHLRMAIKTQWNAIIEDVLAPVLRLDNVVTLDAHAAEFMTEATAPAAGDHRSLFDGEWEHAGGELANAEGALQDRSAVRTTWKSGRLFTANATGLLRSAQNRSL